MKRIGSFFFLFLYVLSFTSCVHKEKKILRDIASLQSMGGMEGIWFLQGTSSTRGPYNGELELRKSHDGTYDVVRIATYINYFYDGLKVQEVWTGKALANEDSLVVTFDLRQADFISRLGAVKREPGDFQNPITVVARFHSSPSGLSTKYSDAKVSSYSEWITTKRDLEPKPLWVNERQKLDGSGPKSPAAIRNMIRSFKASIGFDKDAIVKSYKERPEFKAEQPYFIFDPTDFDFYRSNNDLIRVVNKITDDISIAESVVKRNSYAPTLTQKAIGFDRNARDVLALQASGEDAAFLTGMYLGSQAMRHLATGSPEALESVRQSFKKLVTISDLKSESSVIGVAHGLLWAGLVIPKSDTKTRAELRQNSLRLLNVGVVSESPRSRFTVLGLAAMITGDPLLKEQYQSSYRDTKTVRTGNIETPFYWQGTSDWTAVHLNLIGAITDISVAEILGVPEIRDQLRERLMDSWVTHAPAQRHLLTLAAYGFAYKNGTRGEKMRSQNSEERFVSALSQAVWGLRETPYPLPNLDVSVDHSLKPEWCLSPTPRNFWKSTKSPGAALEEYYQGLYNYPVFELQAFSSKNLWSDPPFRYKARSDHNVEGVGLDYLYAYWLSRFAGVNTGD